MGSVTPASDFLLVCDTVRAFPLTAAAEGIEGETIHVGTGVGVSIGETAERLMAIAARELPIVSEARRVRTAGSEVMGLLCDPIRAEARSGFRAEVSLDEGLREVYR